MKKVDAAEMINGHGNSDDKNVDHIEHEEHKKKKKKQKVGFRDRKVRKSYLISLSSIQHE